MKFFTITALLTLTSLTPQTTAVSSQELCRVHRPKVYQAIDRLCGNTDIHIPSALAANGKWDDEHKAKVAIGGACWPAQWVPQKFCKVQFWNMCARKGRGKWYGRNQCQFWQIQYDGDVLMKVWNWKRKQGESMEVKEGEGYEGMDEYAEGEIPRLGE